MLIDLTEWEPRFAAYLRAGSAGDVAHDAEHVRRVLRNARWLAAAEGADQAVVVPAAWLHDCVAVPKDSPQRRMASTMAAAAAGAFLADAGYPPALIPAIAHAIAAHSFSAGIAPQTIEARVVQDADRLDALGAVGLARTLMLGATLGRPLYDPAAPFPTARPADDAVSSIDHLYTKLLTLAATMQTESGRREADRRTEFLHEFLRRLAEEIGG